MTSPRHTAQTWGDLDRYTRCAQASSARVIAAYSTSFGVATRVLGPGTREHVRNIYGLVRLADELVDGAAAQAGMNTADQRRMLDALEVETCSAIEHGFSTNLVVHAFAHTARRAGIGSDLTGPFFASMRRDLGPGVFDADGVRDYIYGSAEVVGLMCLRVFLRRGQTEKASCESLEEGARRLGAAFQKVNFLRDLAVDWGSLGRGYFPGIDPEHLTEAQKIGLVEDIDADLAAAALVISGLPRDARSAVAAAHGLFKALNDRIRRTPAEELAYRRVRVPGWQKSLILARALSRGMAATA